MAALKAGLLPIIEVGSPLFFGARFPREMCQMPKKLMRDVMGVWGWRATTTVPKAIILMLFHLAIWQELPS
jgi:hypothetical protein